MILSSAQIHYAHQYIFTSYEYTAGSDDFFLLLNLLMCAACFKTDGMKLLREPHTDETNNKISAFSANEIAHMSCVDGNDGIHSLFVCLLVCNLNVMHS